jgi:hypothetical protein
MIGNDGDTSGVEAPDVWTDPLDRLDSLPGVMLPIADTHQLLLLDASRLLFRAQGSVLAFSVAPSTSASDAG